MTTTERRGELRARRLEDLALDRGVGGRRRLVIKAEQLLLLADNADFPNRGSAVLYGDELNAGLRHFRSELPSCVVVAHEPDEVAAAFERGDLAAVLAAPPITARDEVTARTGTGASRRCGNSRR